MPQNPTLKGNGKTSEKLIRYLARNGGQATRQRLQQASVLRGAVAEYDAVLESLMAAGTIVCDNSQARKSDWLYKLAQNPANTAVAQVAGGNGEQPQASVHIENVQPAQTVQAVAPTEIEPEAVGADVQPAQATQPTESVTITKMLITPEIAREMLACNKNNRPIKQANVEALVAAIRQGQWVMTGNSIAFDQAGQLLDGQHRLLAIIEAGQAVESLVATGLAKAAFLTTDIGAKRGAADVAAMLGFKCYITTGCAATLLHHYDHNGMRLFKKGVTNQEIQKILSEHPMLQESVDVGRGVANLIPPGIGAFCHYIFSRIDREAADSFFKQLKSGANLRPKSPILVLRDKLMFHKAGKLMLSRQAIAALTIKAWNCFRKGKEVANINWKPREQFPRGI